MTVASNSSSQRDLLAMLPDELVLKIFDSFSSLFLDPFRGHGRRAFDCGDLIERYMVP